MSTIVDIAAQLQGYDPTALSADHVNAFLARLVQPVTETEVLPLVQALDRVLARDLISPISVPPHNNSAMDGYAFAGAQMVSGLPTRLRVVGKAMAGATWNGQVGFGECVKIMTGAVMPSGLDTVAPHEMVSRPTTDSVDHADSTVELIDIADGLLCQGDNQRLAGEDLMVGSVALTGGTRLTPAACGLIASLGLAQVRVYRRLKVAYFSTGDEILSLGEAPRDGAVYDSNRYTLAGLLARLGCEAIDLGLIPDQPAELEAAFQRAAAQADVIITSGGVSVGEADHTKAVMRRLGEVAFWRIAMRPGRPMAVGTISQGQRSSVLFGLPGNPVAVMVTFLAFVRPALLQMMGCRPTQAPFLKAHSLENIRKKPGRTEYQRGVVSVNHLGQLVVRTTGNQGSGVLSSMVLANGLIVLHHGQGSVSPGDEVDVMMFEGVM